MPISRFLMINSRYKIKKLKISSLKQLCFRHRLKLSQRRYSAGTLSGDPYRTGENKKMRRSSVCDSQTGSSTSSWATVLAPLDQNIQGKCFKPGIETSN